MHAVCKDCPRQRARPPGGRQALSAGHSATVSIVAHPFAKQHAYRIALLQEPTGTRCLRPSRRACRPAQTSQICRTHCRSEQLVLGQGLARSARAQCPPLLDEQESRRAAPESCADAWQQPGQPPAPQALAWVAVRGGAAAAHRFTGKIPTLLPAPLNTAPPSSLLFPQARLLGPALGALAAAAPRGAPPLAGLAAGGGGCGWARPRDAQPAERAGHRARPRGAAAAGLRQPDSGARRC